MLSPIRSSSSQNVSPIVSDAINQPTQPFLIYGLECEREKVREALRANDCETEYRTIDNFNNRFILRILDKNQNFLPEQFSFPNLPQSMQAFAQDHMKQVKAALSQDMSEELLTNKACQLAISTACKYNIRIYFILDGILDHADEKPGTYTTNELQFIAMLMKQDQRLPHVRFVLDNQFCSDDQVNERLQLFCSPSPQRVYQAPSSNQMRQGFFNSSTFPLPVSAPFGQKLNFDDNDEIDLNPKRQENTPDMQASKPNQQPQKFGLG
tara:strand:- start:789 stop:1589 length:801 start_codon:yes stop_codon:yes gene_type:complete